MDLYLLVKILKETLDIKSEMILLQKSNFLKDQILERQSSQRKGFGKNTLDSEK